MILLSNTTNYAISLGAEVKALADLATALSVTGLYEIHYWCYDGTNVAVTHSEALV